jgi:predicted component of type VI protein secretion system
MSDAKQESQAAPAETVLEKSVLDQIVEEGRFAKDVAGRERGKKSRIGFVSQVLEGAMTVSKDAEAMINARIAQIDHLISIQLNEILHHDAVPEAGSLLARIEIFAGSERNRLQPENQSPERFQKGTVARSATGAGVRSERAF